MVARSCVLIVAGFVAACHGAPLHGTPGELSGTVTVDGAPVAGAQVRLVNSSLAAASDAKGAFTIGPLASATYALSMSFDAGAYAGIVEGIRFDAATGDDIGTIALERTGGIAGRVLLSGTPVAQAALALVDSNGAIIAGAPVAVSDASGAYSIASAPTGQFTVKALFSVNSQMVSALSQSVSIGAGSQVAVDLDLQSPSPAVAGTVSGQAVYVDGVEQIALFLSRAGQADLAQAASSTKFTQSAVPPGLYALGVSANGLAPVAVPNVFVDGDVNVGTVVFSKTDATATAVCASLTPPPCMAGQPGCDPDNTSPTPTGEEVNAACLCQPGVFLAADGTCVDECIGATCNVNAACLGGTGTYYCTCDSGYEGDGMTCEAIIPEINELNVSPPALGLTEGAVITASFQANELISLARVSVTVGTAAMTWPFGCTEMGTEPWIYVCTYPMTGTEIPLGTEQNETVTATISDARGNSNTATGYVYFDFKVPAIASLSVAYANGATTAAPGSTVTVSLTSDEPFSTAKPPSVGATLTSGTMQFALDSSSLTNDGASFTGTVPAGTPSGAYQLTVLLTDFVGNESTLQPDGGLVEVSD